MLPFTAKGLCRCGWEFWHGGIVLDYLGWAQRHHRGPYKWEREVGEVVWVRGRCADAAALALKTEDALGPQAASGMGRAFPSEPPAGTQPCQHLHFSRGKPLLDLWPPDCNVIICIALGHHVCGNMWQQQKETNTDAHFQHCTGGHSQCNKKKNCYRYRKEKAKIGVICK